MPWKRVTLIRCFSLFHLVISNTTMSVTRIHYNFHISKQHQTFQADYYSLDTETLLDSISTLPGCTVWNKRYAFTAKSFKCLCSFKLPLNDNPFAGIRFVHSFPAWFEWLLNCKISRRWAFNVLWFGMKIHFIIHLLPFHQFPLMKGQVLLLSNSIDSAEETHSIITHVFMQKNDAERNDVMYYIQSKVVRL